MYRQSKNLTWGRAAASTILNAFSVAPGGALIAAPTIGLWKSADFTPNSNTILAAFTAVQADFSGYAQQNLTLSDVVNLSSGVIGVVGDVTFNSTDVDPFVQSTIYGYWIQSAGGIIAFEKFEANEEVPIGTFGDFLGLDVNVPFTLTQNAEAV